MLVGISKILQGINVTSDRTGSSKIPMGNAQDQWGNLFVGNLELDFLWLKCAVNLLTLRYDGKLGTAKLRLCTNQGTDVPTQGDGLVER